MRSVVWGMSARASGRQCTSEECRTNGRRLLHHHSGCRGDTYYCRRRGEKMDWYTETCVGRVSLRRVERPQEPGRFLRKSTTLDSDMVESGWGLWRVNEETGPTVRYPNSPRSRVAQHFHGPIDRLTHGFICCHFSPTIPCAHVPLYDSQKVLPLSHAAKKTADVIADVPVDRRLLGVSQVPR